MAELIFRCKAAKRYTDENGNDIIEAIDPATLEGYGVSKEMIEKIQDCDLDVRDNGDYVCYAVHCGGNCSLHDDTFTDKEGRVTHFAYCTCP